MELRGIDTKYTPKKLRDNREEEEVREHDAPEGDIVLQREQGRKVFTGWAAEAGKGVTRYL